MSVRASQRTPLASSRNRWPNYGLPHQDWVKSWYDWYIVQWVIAMLIMGNFVTNCVEKEVDPFGDLHKVTFRWVNFAWNIIFIFELLWNMYSNWWKAFCFAKKDSYRIDLWNAFDFLVVAISLPTLPGTDLGAFARMRTLRAFRVFRLFKRVPALRKILQSLARAVPGIVNAAFVMTLVMCIYAILAVDFFGQFGVGGSMTNNEGASVPLQTGRGLDWGTEYYGTFWRAIFTLFQVLTGESWAEAVARPVMFADDGGMQILASIFYVTFVMLNSFVLINVVVAVLLEKMVEPVDDSYDDDDDIAPPAPKMPVAATKGATVETLAYEVALLNAKMDKLVDALRVGPNLAAGATAAAKAPLDA